MMLLQKQLTNLRIKRHLQATILSCAIPLHLLAPGHALPESTSITPNNVPTLGASISSTNRDGNKLSLEQFLQLVERNYPKLKGADAERRIAGAKRLEKSGAFDPIITSTNEYLRIQDTFKPGVAKDAIHNETRLDLLTRSGIKLFAGARINPNDTKTPFLPTGRGGEYSAGMTVPLLRGLKINEKAASEEQAKLGEPVAAQIYGVTRLEVLLKAAALYWEWVGAKVRIGIAQNLLAVSQARVDQIKERVRKGDLPALDIAEQEQEIQRRQAALIKCQREFQKAAISASVLLWDDAGTPKSMPPLEDVPELQPLPRKLTEDEWSEGRKSALALRPELKRIALERDQARIDLKLAKNMILPAVDAYFLQGADTGYQGIGPVVRAGMAMSLPLRQRTARGQAQAAQLKIQKLNLDERAEKQRIQAEVDDTVSAINTSFERWQATQIEVGKARQVENGERMRFGAGDSTLFLVNQRERASAEAEMKLAEVHVEYLQAMAAFKTVTGRI